VVTRTLISLAPLAAACALIGFRVLATARRRRREDRETARRIEAAVAARSAERAYLDWLEERFEEEARQP
jgi:hypothetical protein